MLFSQVLQMQHEAFAKEAYGFCVQRLGGIGLENFVYTVDNQRKIEKFLLVIYTVYNSFMITEALEQKWGEWFTILLLIGLSACWIINVGKYKDYVFRAKLSAVIFQITVTLYAVCMEKLSSALPIFIVSVVLLGLYGIEQIILFTIIPAVFIFLYHGFIACTIPMGSIVEIRKVIVQLINVFLLEQTMYTWTKRNREGSYQLIEVIKELKSVENSKDDFLANVSHEIRTPINTICGMGELLQQDELPDSAKERVRGIQTAGRNLMGIVSDILDFSELHTGRIEYEEEAYNIASTINDIINMTIARKNEKNIELIVDCDANIPCALLGDEKKLRRVIMNLVNNAIKFTEKGCVSIIVGFRRESYGINLLVTVKDTGIGIDEKNLEKIFTSFNQADTSRKRQEGGLGLGLAISQALVQKMGGAITIKSKPGKGTTVRFVVPQKVLDEAPVAAINDRESVNVATYIDMEQFDMEAIRDEYSSNIIHMAEQLRGRCCMCRNLAELQRREEKEHFSHIFISFVEYREDMEYFDKLAKQTNVVIVLNRSEEKYITNPDFLKIYKPFYILTIVSVLNGQYDKRERESTGGKFTTHDARVLVVDDNKMNIRVIEGFLESYRIKVTTAQSGGEALEKITSEDYDFVFMDHMMPEMDGVEALHRIRNKVGSYYRKVPIIALTANAVAGTREMLIAEGFNDFLEKPVERSVLERVLKRNLPPEKIIDLDNHTKPDRNEEELCIEGLDVKSGMLYCNGWEQYIKILQGFCKDYETSRAQLKEFFENKDWTDYTIAVHGIKSAMKSIGAVHISELARRLEAAGRENRLDYIFENHNELMSEYARLYSQLKKKDCILSQLEQDDDKHDNNEEEVQENLPSLSKEELEGIIEKMETAAYGLNGEELFEEIDKLCNYSYCNVPLRKHLVPVRHKVEMSDYVSAVEMIMGLKSKLEERGE